MTLFDEARYAMQLSHKHIVRLHNIQETNQLYYLVMEFIDGCTLRDMLVAEGPMSMETMAQFADVMGDALGYAHRHNIYHRDLKPDNIMVSSDGVLKIIYFGLACLARQTRASNDICGTPYYVSPEEIRGDSIDQRGDIYSLGVTLHELMTGVLPVGVSDPPENFMDYVPEVSPFVPEPVRSILQQSLSVNPDNRWSDVSEFCDALSQACLVVAESSRD
jgi:serine/threonine-protein kinase